VYSMPSITIVANVCACWVSAWKTKMFEPAGCSSWIEPPDCAPVTRPRPNVPASGLGKMSVVVISGLSAILIGWSRNSTLVAIVCACPITALSSKAVAVFIIIGWGRLSRFSATRIDSAADCQSGSCSCRPPADIARWLPFQSLPSRAERVSLSVRHWGAAD
jgi:hypothetical protein